MTFLGSGALTLTPSQIRFAESHRIDAAAAAFSGDSAVYMYSCSESATDRWLVLPNGETAEYDHFERSPSLAAA